MADSDNEKLKKVLTESFRNKAKDTLVKKALRDRIAKKKAKKKGAKFDKFVENNLKAPLSDIGQGALDDAAEISSAKDRVRDAANRVEAEKNKPVPRVKTNVFGIGQAATNIRKIKNDPRKTGN